jgi:hypothetical protein
MHPEYHALINNVELDYFPEQGEVNPFLHINLHLSLKSGNINRAAYFIYENKVLTVMVNNCTIISKTNG